MKNKFKLTNLVLYAKGWYHKTDNIWEDLQKILELDNYSPFDKSDIYSIIVSSVQDSQIYRWTEMKEVLNGIHPTNCWKYGYFTKNCNWVKDSENLPEYDMPTAFIHYTISNLRFMDNSNWNPQMPKVNKYPKSKEITINKLYEFFGKKSLISNN